MTIADIKNEENSVSEDEIEVSKNEDIKEDVKSNNESTEDKLKASQEKLLRTMAEMENQRRRFEKENKESFEYGGFSFAGESLALLDNIDRAIVSFKNDESLKNNNDLDKIIDGIEIVKKDLVSIFKKNGITPIDCINKKFDPNFHQAMLEIEDETKDSGVVVQEIQKGYMMKSRLLRPSFVGVTKKREQSRDTSQKDGINTEEKEVK
jgi:molecular chaperone GrpE